MWNWSMNSCNMTPALPASLTFCCLFVLRRHLCDWAVGLRGLPWILHHHRGYRWWFTAAQWHGHCEHQPDWCQWQPTCLQPGRLHSCRQRRHRAGEDCNNGKNIRTICREIYTCSRYLLDNNTYHRKTFFYLFLLTFLGSFPFTQSLFTPSQPFSSLPITHRIHLSHICTCGKSPSGGTAKLGPMLFILTAPLVLVHYLPHMLKRFNWKAFDSLSSYPR